MPPRAVWKIRLVVRGPEVLDLPRPAPGGPHDLHCGRARRGLRCPHVRHQATLRAAPSAQMQLQRTGNLQVSDPRNQPRSNRGPTQVNLDAQPRLGQRPSRSRTAIIGHIVFGSNNFRSMLLCLSEVG